MRGFGASSTCGAKAAAAEAVAPPSSAEEGAPSAVAKGRSGGGDLWTGAPPKELRLTTGGSGLLAASNLGLLATGGPARLAVGGPAALLATAGRSGRVILTAAGGFVAAGGFALTLAGGGGRLGPPAPFCSRCNAARWRPARPRTPACIVTPARYLLWLYHGYAYTDYADTRFGRLHGDARLQLSR